MSLAPEIVTPRLVALEWTTSVARLKAQLRADLPEIDDEGSLAQRLLAMAWLELGLETLSRRMDPADVLDHVLAVLEGRSAECVAPGPVSLRSVES